ncbi:bifunctional homocysteine S-methyltransferase/methylenetetrahydrofolate reductase [Thiospirochaeta perfilievii]|uniref:Bifunctional homocysteine S-methyltransferase/methylenetetrahydrofolate reductase n=1 Tax=Thiospirochaeta perfilievii TaxID=252967 RepID=A0A5C1QC17_9SPIO|nr:bifunctional homocysteine S-methyltransferase/methylenetetrahydrofolate reductase [Thiospirochaeta perfilievii]QEN04640.1 bifunctional homocysteine S-methyltransferase/methylenetetrahydrofolate reductase [Thiospirochaeta perfilievii]
MLKINYLEKVKKGITLFDGAMGTMLYDKGVFINRSFEEVNITNPKMVSKIYKEYVEAGAQVLTTNTYTANRINLGGYNLADRVEDIIKSGVLLAKEAAGDELYVAGSIGRAPNGTSYKEEIEALTEQVKLLIDCGVDIILFESFSDIDLLLELCEITKKYKNIPVQAQFTLPPVAPSEYIKLGRLYAQRLDRSKFTDVIGINCTMGPAEMLEILQDTINFIHKPFSIIPNAGHPKVVDGRQLYLSTPEYFAEYAKRFLDGGASVTGGCCGTTPQHIKKMADAVLSLDRGYQHIELAQVEDGVEFKTPLPLEKRSSLGRALKEGKWIETVELVSPMGSDISGFMSRVKLLDQAGVKYINIPDGPRASSRMSAFGTALHIKQSSNIEPILHVCGRDKNLIAMQADFLGAESFGLRDMLLVTGDPPKVGKYPDVTGVFDVDSIGMLDMTKRLNSNVDIGGASLTSGTAFVSGAGINPVAPFIDREIERAFQKAEAGAEFFISQPVYDIDLLSKFIDRIKGTGVPVIIGVWPLASYRNALFLQNEVPGVEIPKEIMTRMEKHSDKESARRDGVLIAREIVASLKEKIQGVQVSPPFGNINTALEVLSKDIKY